MRERESERESLGLGRSNLSLLSIVKGRSEATLLNIKRQFLNVCNSYYCSIKRMLLKCAPGESFT